MKDAYLIIAHKQWDLLKACIRALDYCQNDIFVHIDKKSAVDLNSFKDCAKKSKLWIFQQYDVQWGTQTQVDAEMFLFQTAYRRGYRYYHLLSGQDLPIKPVDKIYDFFTDKHVEYLAFDADNQDKHRFRLGQYHYRGTNAVKRAFFFALNILNGKMGKDRFSKYGLKVYKGSNWASLTNEAVRYLIERRQMIKRMTRYSHCADEVYKHTLLMNADQAFCINSGKDIRYIDWEHNEGSSPHTLRIDDYDNLMKSDCLFARKFDLDVDSEIVRRILEINR